MSEIRVTTLKDTSGNNSSTTADIFSGRAKAWVNFNGVGTVAIRANFNVNSISDNSQGDFSVNLSNALADANYAFIAIGYANAGDATTLRGVEQFGAGTSISARMVFINGLNNNLYDPAIGNCAFFR